MPPLKYDYAYQLKRDFPALEIIINGGIKTTEEIDLHLQHIDGVMLGREAYHNPYMMAGFDARYYGDETPVKTRAEVIALMLPYIRDQLQKYGSGKKSLKLNSITRHMLGLTTGMVGARAFRQVLSDSKKLASGNPELLVEALQRVHAF